MVGDQGDDGVTTELAEATYGHVVDVHAADLTIKDAAEVVGADESETLRVEDAGEFDGPAGSAVGLPQHPARAGSVVRREPILIGQVARREVSRVRVAAQADEVDGVEGCAVPVLQACPRARERIGQRHELAIRRDLVLEDVRGEEAYLPRAGIQEMDPWDA